MSLSGTNGYDNDNKVQKYLENINEDWNKYRELCEENGEHNPLCSVNSESCSISMSKTNDGEKQLCQWHRLRIAQHKVVSCNCKKHDICVGDATARIIFREYYEIDDIAVIDSFGKLYCCSYCQNAECYRSKCGDMYVCPSHEEDHKELTKISKSENLEQSDSDSDNEF